MALINSQEVQARPGCCIRTSQPKQTDTFKAEGNFPSHVTRRESFSCKTINLKSSMKYGSGLGKQQSGSYVIQQLSPTTHIFLPEISSLIFLRKLDELQCIEKVYFRNKYVKNHP